MVVFYGAAPYEGASLQGSLTGGSSVKAFGNTRANRLGAGCATRCADTLLIRRSPACLCWTESTLVIALCQLSSLESTSSGYVVGVPAGIADRVG